MTERADIVTDWSESPRIIEVASPSVNLTMQDLHDTCRSNTKQAGEGGDTLANMDDESIIDSAGKEDLGGGVLVGITATLQNAQVAFESRLTPSQTGTITNGDAGGTAFEDSAALLITNGVGRGDVLINFADESVTEILEVLTETTATTRVLRAGTLNQYTVADAYKIWPVIQCELEGGNLTAVDTDGVTPISAVFPTAFTQIVRTSSSSATLREQADIEYASFNSGVTVDTTSAYAGTVFPTGTPRQPVNNLTDALAIANERGFDRFYIIGSITVSIGPDFSNKIFEGQSALKTTITVPAAATVNDCEYNDATMIGTLDGSSLIERCVVGSLDFVSGFIYLSGIQGPVSLGGNVQANFLDCFSVVAGGGFTPVIDMGGAGQALVVRNWGGGIEIQNKTGTDAASIDLNSGQVIINDNNTGGEITLRGVAKWTNEETYAGTTVVNNELLTSQQLREVWKIFGLDKSDPVNVTPGGIDSDSGDIDINFTGDGITLTRMARA